MSRRDSQRSDIRFMSGNEVPPGSGHHAPLGRVSPATTAASAAEAIWLCPTVVALTGLEITAALYAFSDLIHDVPEPTCRALREELSFLVARYGTAMIDGVADWIALSRATSASVVNTEVDGGQGQRPPADRLTWCQKQSLLLLSAEAA